MTNKFEQLLELLINEEQDKAEALFHEIVVEKSRDIYENLADSETTTEAMHDKKDKKSSIFSFDPFDDDDDDDDYKSAKGQEILSDFTKGFKFF